MKHTLFSILFLLLGCTLFAQDLSTPEKGLWPETPQAATLREVTMPPPALSTGAVNLSIPIYTLQVEDLEIPFELQYHSNGIKVSDDPYPTGYGWTLTPALKITRCVMGRPDGEGYQFIGDRSASSLTHGERQRCMVARTSPVVSSRLDSERDLFTVHLPGISFNAFLANGKPTAPGHSEYVITATDKLKSLTVTDPYGRIWTFDVIGARWMNESPMEWCASSVKLPSGRTITFGWKSGMHGSYSSGSWYMYILHYPLSRGSWFPDSSYGGRQNIEDGLSDQSMDLTSITFPGGSVTLTYSGGSIPTTLKDITVKSGSAVVDQITFAYGSSTDNTMLNSVVFRDGSKYLFTYDAGRFGAHDSADYWGYYNRGGGSLTAPSMSIGPIGGMQLASVIEGSDRSPNQTYMTARLLKSVTYPTGGICEWEYEPHEFAPENFIDSPDISATKDKKLSIGGGVRVKRQTLRESSSDTSPIIVDYIYGEDGDGLAIVEAFPTASTFLSRSNSVGYQEITTESGFTPGRAECGIISASPSSNYSSYRIGDPVIWYSQVEERHSEGRIVHHFEKNDANEYTFVRLRGYLPINLHSFFSCGIVETLTETYGTRAGKETLIEKRESEYSLSSLHNPYGGIIIRRQKSQSHLDDIAPDFPEAKEITLASGKYTYGDDEIYDVFPYKVYPTVYSLSSVRTTRYTPTGNIVTTEEMEFADDTGLCTSRTQSDNVSTSRTEYTYSDSFSSTVAAAMKKANVVGVVTGIRHKRGSAVTEEKMEFKQIGTGSLFRPVSLRRSRGNATPYIVQSYTWNTDGTLASHQGPDGVKTTYTWDQQGLHPLSSTVGGMLTSKATWNNLIGVATLTDPAGVTEVYTYDTGNRLATVKKGGRLLTTHTYNIRQDGTSSVQSKNHTSSTTSFQTTSRIDGLGRVWASIASLPGGDATTLTEYDAMGRRKRVWKDAPTVTNATASQIRSAAVTFHSDNSPYEETEYECSPIERPIAMMPGGNKWKSNGKKTTYETYTNGVPTNSAYEMTATSTGVEIKGLYPAGTVTITKETDPDGYTYISHTDSRGLKIYESHGQYGTYYVYDDFGDLRYILPPGSAPQDKRTSATMKRLCYWYDYDSRGRLVTKKLPGAKEEHYLYDPADRLVAEQSIDLPAGVWRLHAYDACGRLVVTFDMEISDSQANTFASQCRTAKLTSGGKYKGYAITPTSGLPSGTVTVVKAFYYDTHDFVTQLALGNNFLFNNPFSTLGITDRVDASYRTGTLTGNSTGKLTGLYTGQGWEAYHYNPMGLEVQRYATGFNRGWTTTFYTYDLKPASVHHVYGGTLPDLDTYMTYDTSSRPTKVMHIQRRKVGGKETCDTAIISTVYDKIGRMESEKLGNVIRKLKYDLHDWLRSATTSTASGTVLYTENMLYEDGATPRYSGKVTSHQWRHGQGGYYDRYDFTYNASGFLTKAAYSDPTDFYQYSVEYTYGMRGEMTALKRKGLIDQTSSGSRAYGLLDDVTAKYEGNHLTQLSVESDAEVFAARVGIRDTGNFSIEYDDAGRLVADESRDIICIDYDNQGLPTRMAFGSGEEYTQVHDSEGRLLSSVTRTLSSSGKTVTKRLTYTGGGHVLRNDTLEMTRFAGGYFAADGKPNYYIRDYRGNNCKVVDRNGGSIQSTNYYPYGEPFSESFWNIDNTGGLKGNRYLFADNERITDLGMNTYDFNARQYVASFPRFTRMDPLCEKYPWLSPYSYCAGDPINLTDPTGEDIVILHDTGVIGHMAMLIQGSDNKWYYYSINGNNVYSFGTFKGGRKSNDIEIGSWDSPEDFMQSSYNSTGGEDGKEDKSVNYYDYEEGYIIKSTPKQDTRMREKFKEISETDYSLMSNNCATTVQRVMEEVGIPINAPGPTNLYTPVLKPFKINNTSNGMKINYNVNITPNHAFKAIMNANREGRYIRK